MRMHVSKFAKIAAISHLYAKLLLLHAYYYYILVDIAFRISLSLPKLSSVFVPELTPGANLYEFKCIRLIKMEESTESEGKLNTFI